MKTTHSARFRLNIFKNEVQDYQLMRTASYSIYGAASLGEVIAVAQKILVSGNTRENWIDEWKQLAQTNEKIASQLVKDGKGVYARDFYLKAYNYYRNAEFYFWSSKHEEHKNLYNKSVECFEKGMSFSEYKWEKIKIPYEGLQMPGYFFKSNDLSNRPTVIITGGGDSFGEEAFFLGGVPEALARNFNVILFHGPGQRSFLLNNPDQIFRADYDKVISRVIDFGIDELKIDPAKIALYGYSLGGYLVSQAVTIDSRISALIPNAPILNFQNFIVGGIYGKTPKLLKGFIENAINNKNSFIWRIIEWKLRKDWVFDATAELYMFWTNGVNSLADYIYKIKEFTIEEGQLNKIKCPTLVVSAEGEGPEPIAQAKRFYELIKCNKYWLNLSDDLGADNHCGLSNIHYTSSTIYDWLNDIFK
jgi:pimeloyl-ACP methyl ester carboxylesterase